MSGYNPTQQLFLDILRALVADRPLEPPEQADWPAVLALAQKHNLVPVLDAIVPAGVLPADVAAQVKSETRRRRMRAAVMIDAFQSIYQALTGAGIAVIPLKGVALAQSIYPSVSLRYFDDLDLLVPADAGSAALEVLAANDYIPHPRAPKPDWHHLIPHIHRQHNVMIEIHTDLVRRARPGWEIEQIWQRAGQSSLGGIESRLMAPEDALIYTALHARHNLFNRLSFFIDAALQCSRQPLDESLLLDLAREAGAHSALEYVLELAGRLLGAADLPAVPGPWRPRWLAGKVAGWQVLEPPRASLKQGPLPKLIELLLMDSLGDSLRLAGRLIAPPPEFVNQGYGQAGGGQAAGYGKRLWQRAGLALGQVTRGFKK